MPAITGLRFLSVGEVESLMLRDCSETSVRGELPGRTVENVSRLGKFLVFRLNGPGEWWLTLHLGMTGQLLVSDVVHDLPGREMDLVPTQFSVHTRFSFLLEGPDGLRLGLYFWDMRKFGRLHLTSGGPAPRLQRLGPDAWIGDWDAGYLQERLRGRRTPIKSFLLDQRNLAGIGNIYADETLWHARIAPQRAAGRLTDEEVDGLAAEIRAQLSEGVRRLGCTLADFVDIRGRAGTFQERLQAYGRQGEPCSRCGETLVRAVVAGRGTTYCPVCQR